MTYPLTFDPDPELPNADALAGLQNILALLQDARQIGKPLDSATLGSMKAHAGKVLDCLNKDVNSPPDAMVTVSQLLEALDSFNEPVVFDPAVDPGEQPPQGQMMAAASMPDVRVSKTLGEIAELQSGGMGTPWGVPAHTDVTELSRALAQKYGPRQW